MSGAYLHQHLPKELHLRVVGHSTGKDGSSRTYMEDFAPKQIYEEMLTKVPFHEMIDLSHSKKSRWANTCKPGSGSLSVGLVRSLGGSIRHYSAANPLITM